MILVDTNIIIDFWDKPTEDAKKVFEDNEIATCGVIKTELLRGSNSDKTTCINLKCLSLVHTSQLYFMARYAIIAS